MFEGLKLYSVWIAATIVWVLLAKELISSIIVSKSKKNKLIDNNRQRDDLLTSGEPVLIVKKAQRSSFQAFTINTKKSIQEAMIRVKRKLIQMPLIRLQKQMLQVRESFVTSLENLRLELRFQFRKSKVKLNNAISGIKTSILTNGLRAADATANFILNTVSFLVVQPVHFVVRSFKNVFVGIAMDMPIFVLRTVVLVSVGCYQFTKASFKSVFRKPKEATVDLYNRTKPLVETVLRKTSVLVFRLLAISVMTACYPFKVLMDWADSKFVRLMAQYKNENIEILEDSTEASSATLMDTETYYTNDSSGLEFRLGEHFIIESRMEDLNFVNTGLEMTSLSEMDSFIAQLNANKPVLILSELEGFSSNYPKIDLIDPEFELDSVLVKDYSKHCDLIVNCESVETATEIYERLKDQYSEFYFLNHREKSLSESMVNVSEEPDAII